MKKNIVKVLALVLVAAALCTVFAACGNKLSGKYSAEIAGTGATMEFKGSKVTTTYKALGKEVYSVEGEYSIEDDKITFTYEGEDADKAKDYSGTFDFKEGKDEDGKAYIKIGLITYKKAD